MNEEGIDTGNPIRSPSENGYDNINVNAYDMSRINNNNYLDMPDAIPGNALFPDMNPGECEQNAPIDIGMDTITTSISTTEDAKATTSSWAANDCETKSVKHMSNIHFLLMILFGDL